MDFGLQPSFFGGFDCGDRFANTAQSVIDLSEFCVSSC